MQASATSAPATPAPQPQRRNPSAATPAPVTPAPQGQSAPAPQGQSAPAPQAQRRNACASMLAPHQPQRPQPELLRLRVEALEVLRAALFQ